MLYKELYKESNELAKERFALVRERVAEIEEKPETEENSITHQSVFHTSHFFRSMTLHTPRYAQSPHALSHLF